MEPNRKVVVETCSPRPTFVIAKLLLRSEEIRRGFALAAKTKGKAATASRQVAPVDKSKIVFIPGFIKAKDLARLLRVEVDEVLAFARTHRFHFAKPSELIFDWHHSSQLAKSFKRIPIYHELDLSRPDYWSDETTTDKSGTQPLRPCVVSVLGHIDHGKTTLLDALSNSDVARHEAGNITQSLSAFTVDLRELGKTESNPSEESEKSSPYSKFLSPLFVDKTGRTVATSGDIVTFLDTPGHSIFSRMRQFGAAVADLVVLIIAANEGVQPQTIEAIKIAVDARTPIIVAVNKIDVATPEQIESVYTQLHRFKLAKPSLTRNSSPLRQNPPNYSALFEDLDEEHPVVGVCEISAKVGTNLSVLKKTIMETASALEDSRRPPLTIKASTPESTISSLRDNGVALGSVNLPESVVPTAEATVIESYVKSSEGRVLLLVTHRGIIKTGAEFVCDRFRGRVRSIAISDLRYIPKQAIDNSSFSKVVSEALPGLPALVTVGLESEVRGDVVPPPGAGFFQLESNDVDTVYEYRTILMQFMVRKMQNQLFKPERGLEIDESSDVEKSTERAKIEKLLSPAKQRREERLKQSKTAIDMKREKREAWLKQSAEAERWKGGKIEDIEETTPFLSVIVKADNHGRLDAILDSTKQIAAEMGVKVRYTLKLKILHQGVGDVVATDLEFAQVEAEENKALRIPFLLFNVDVSKAGEVWIGKNRTRKGVESFHFHPQKVFFELLNDLRSEVHQKYPELKDKQEVHPKANDEAPIPTKKKKKSLKLKSKAKR